MTLSEEALAPPAAAASQERWRQTRQMLNARRVPLSRAVADLYGDAHMSGTGLLVDPSWLPETPVRLADIGLAYNDAAPPPAVVGTDACTSAVRPLAEDGRRFVSYSQAVQELNRPRLFEDRFAWRLLGVDWASSEGAMSFGDMSYFGFVDLGEAVAHEAAGQLVQPDGRVGPATWDGLTARQALADPFDPSRRAIGAAIDTLTIRRSRDGATFVLHERNAGSVAMAGGMQHVMPCGIFQPASTTPASMAADFGLWRNTMREYAEEFQGVPEHRSPVDYTAPPFDLMQQALDDGRIRAYCLGVGLDALTLVGEILTVAVFDADVYNDLFAGMADGNREGSIAEAGRAVPFTAETIDELVDGGRLAPAAAGLLRLAWQHRRTILDG